MVDNDRNLDLSKLFHDINIWEETTIKSIKAIAEQTREEAKEHIRGSRPLLSEHLNQIKNQQQSKVEGHIETHLQHWNHLLGQLKINFNTILSSIKVQTSNNQENLHNSIKLSQTIIETPRVRPTLVTHGAKIVLPARKIPEAISSNRNKIPETACSLDSHGFRFLADVSRDPTRMITIGGTVDRAMGASKNNLVVYNENDIITINSKLNERRCEWRNKTIVDICYCSPDTGFILLTENQVFTFSALNQTHRCLATITSDGENKFSTCTSNEQSLLIACRTPGTSIDQWDSNSWKRVKQWKPPDTCGRTEYINRLRYCSDSSNLGMIINSSGELRFELRDENLRILPCVHIGRTGCCGFTSMPKSNWLISDGHSLYIIDQKGGIETIERKTSPTVYNDAGNVAVLADKYIVLRSHKVLYFYETSFS